MKERVLELLFSAFLKDQKGYPQASLFYEAQIKHRFREGTHKKYYVDLLILDTELNNYLALVEFKSNINDQVLKTSYDQVKTYLSSMSRTGIPAYLVVGDEQNFIIYQFSKKEWIKIDNADFPEYQTLQAKTEADIKITTDEINEEKYIDAKSKRELLKSTAWSTLVSLIIGISTVIYFSNNLLHNEGNKEKELISLKNDSTAILIASLSKKMIILEDSLFKSKIIDTTTFQIKKLLEIEKRVENFESSVTSNPDRLLKLQEINFEFRNLENIISKEKEISEIKITNVKEKLDQVIIYTSGLIITIIGSILGFAFNAFKRK